ncbi:uncharacterized protein Gasu_10080 [Galdieria sulphuraria]|uniref:Exosome complex component MTR3, animal type n=1 Tax=Galdieria sulphuraria TaxID=130081 RepID=M2Y7C8_GALSU|nr:uncharacterized protein Gasu_10080 [Galdieria sulphuraria]EME31943.1 exosome complex component MTR3, animal type [Galdieria sulphuraria]|eukprot:XP_005708463.1 exosome complex component MTR3, animal type [Galdieria sulphuraria]
MERRISQRYGPFFEPIHSLEREYQRTRPNNAPRSLVLNTGTVVDAAGSGYVELGKTKVIVAVQGPRPPIRIRGGVENTMNGRITCEVVKSSFCYYSYESTRMANVGRGVSEEERLLSTRLVRVFEPIVILDKYPKCSIDLYVVILEDDGSAFAAMTLATSLALADASIEIISVVSSVTVAISTKQEYLVDPDRTESECAVGLITVSLPLHAAQLCEIQHTGKLSIQVWLSAVQLAVEVAQTIGNSMCQFLLQEMEKNETPSLCS